MTGLPAGESDWPGQRQARREGDTGARELACEGSEDVLDRNLIPRDIVLGMPARATRCFLSDAPRLPQTTSTGRRLSGGGVSRPTGWIRS